MIVRRLSEINGTARHVAAPTWESRRLLVADDGMGFSVHDTEIKAGTTTHMRYRHHLEAVYCVSGTGTLEDLATGEHHPIAPGTIYALDQHDEHVLRAHENLRLVCVFNPPCIGDEEHDAEGGYPLPSRGAPA